MIYSKEILQEVLDNIVLLTEYNPNKSILFNQIIWPFKLPKYLKKQINLDYYAKIVYIKKLIMDNNLTVVYPGNSYQITAEGIINSRQMAYLNEHIGEEYFFFPPKPKKKQKN